MAARRRQAALYRTQGSVAYAPAYDGAAVRSPGGQEVLQPKPRFRERERALTRTQVQVRPAGQVSPLTVLGFALVGVFAAFLLMSYAQYTALADELVSLRGQMNTLQTENAALSAEYERVFDLERIQAAVGGTMVRPSAGQIEYIDLSEADSVELYGQTQGTSGVAGVLEGLRDAAAGVIEYFR